MKIADAKELKGVVAKMSTEHLRCRDYGHKWVLYRCVRVRGGYERSLYCPSCKTARHQFVSARSGDVLAKSYKYAPGYQIQGLGRIQSEAKGVLRLEALNRTTAEGDYVIEIDELND